MSSRIFNTLSKRRTIWHKFWQEEDAKSSQIIGWFCPHHSVIDLEEFSNILQKQKKTEDKYSVFFHATLRIYSIPKEL